MPNNVWEVKNCNLGGLVIDQYDDLFKEDLRRIKKESEVIPPEVTHSDVPSPERVEGLGDRSFGLVILSQDNRKIRKYPVDSPASTYLSLKFFILHKESLPYDAQVIAAKNIVDACKKYGLDVPIEIRTLSQELSPDKTTMAKEAAIDEFSASFVQESMSKFAEQTKTMSAKDKVQFAFKLEKRAKELGLTVPGIVSKMASFCRQSQPAERTIMGKYPVNNEKQIKQASKYLDIFSLDMTPSFRMKFASELSKVAHELNVELTGSAEVLTEGTYDPDQLVNARALRKQALEQRNDYESLQCLDKLFKLASMTDPTVFSRMLITFDTGCDLDYYWGRSIPLPEEILKKASIDVQYLPYNNVLADHIVDGINKKRFQRSKVV